MSGCGIAGPMLFSKRWRPVALLNRLWNYNFGVYIGMCIAELLCTFAGMSFSLVAIGALQSEHCTQLDFDVHALV
jgi:hypothetical protein